jgi:hypothetical protein
LKSKKNPKIDFPYWTEVIGMGGVVVVGTGIAE